MLCSAVRRLHCLDPPHNPRNNLSADADPEEIERAGGCGEEYAERNPVAVVVGVGVREEDQRDADEQ